MIMQNEIEKAADEYVYERQKIRHYAKREEDATIRDFDKTAKAWDSYDMMQAFESGANLFLGKQNDADTVIQGWVCRDKKDNALNLHAEEPYRAQSGYDVCDEPDWWESDCASFLPLDKSLFPDLTWDDEPQQVEIIIKRKKK